MATAYVGQMIDVDSEGNERLLHPETVIDAIPGLRDLLNGFQDGINGLNAAMPTFQTGKYSGTNTMPFTLTFETYPKLVLIYGGTNQTIIIGDLLNESSYTVIAHRQASQSASAKKSGNSISISGNVNGGMNASGDTYYWIAIL